MKSAFNSKFIASIIASMALISSNSIAQTMASVQFSNLEVQPNELIGSELGSTDFELKAQRPSPIFEEMAGSFISFITDSQKFSESGNMSNASQISKSLETSAKHIHSDGIEGAKALAVLASSEVEDFVNGVIEVAKFEGKEALVQHIIENPSYVKSFNGYDVAKARASGYLSWAISKSQNSSAKLVKFSYDAQKLGWAKVSSDTQARLNAIAISWDAPKANFTYNINNLGTSNGEVIVGDKIIAASALIALGEESKAMEMINGGGSKSCAKLAYLNLRQCVAATKYPFEQSFCLAKHGIDEYENCIEKGLK